VAVDFPAFYPHTWAKTHLCGYSLMDVGVGVFCVINGMSAPELHPTPSAFW
jgi:hypothetical protein